MTKRLPAILAALISLALLPVAFADAYAKWPAYNGEHAVGQFGMLLLVPMGIAIVVLGLWAMRARHVLAR